MYIGLVKYAYNTAFQESNKITPYEALYGFPASFPFEAALTDMGLSEGQYPDSTAPVAWRARELRAIMRTIWDTTNGYLRDAQELQRHYHDKHRQQMNFKPGDLVTLAARRHSLSATRADRTKHDKDRRRSITSKNTGE